MVGVVKRAAEVIARDVCATVVTKKDSHMSRLISDSVHVFWPARLCFTRHLLNIIVVYLTGGF